MNQLITSFKIKISYKYLCTRRIQDIYSIYIHLYLFLVIGDRRPLLRNICGTNLIVAV